MAKQSRIQLKAWFDKGKYPTASQFADWIDSFFHKDEDKIPISMVNELTDRLNGKYEKSQGEALERSFNDLSKDNEQHKKDNAADIKQINEELDALDKEYERQQAEIDDLNNDVDSIRKKNEEQDAGITALHKTDTDLQNSLDSARSDIGKIRELIKTGSTLDDTKAAMLALGENYLSLYALASTVKTFIETTDTKDATINTWKEVENFLQGITDSDSLTALLEALEQKITAAYTTAIKNAMQGKADREHKHTLAEITDYKEIIVDSELSKDSTHAVQNNVVTQALSEKQNVKDDSLKTKNKTIVGAINELADNGSLSEVLHATTYAELVALRKAQNLMPGHWYRITDFVTTVANDTEARSAGHPFDILVLATNSGTLSEEARAVANANDNGYFADANLNAWKVWYSLANDTTRFKWADETNGRGVIYRLIDEWQNDCPYDFKNVQFKRYAITDITSTSLTSDVVNNLKSTYCHGKNGGRCFAAKNVYGNWIPNNSREISYEIDEKTFEWYYTFCGLSSDDRTTIADNYDMSSRRLKLTDECLQYIYDTYSSSVNSEDMCHNNIIKPAYIEFDQDDEYYKGRRVFNNIVFINGLTYCYYNHEDGCWVYNTGHCCGNVFGVECKNSTFGVGFKYNTFGNGCCDNTFGNNCFCNTFGNDCSWSTFGDYLQHNTFGNDCMSNTFGSTCCDNTFGGKCSTNTFGGYFQRNTLSDCNDNTFGNYLKHLTMNDGIQYVSVVGGASSSSWVQNAQILNGTSGSSISNRLQISFKANVKYCQFASLNSSGNLKIWTPADLV